MIDKNENLLKSIENTLSDILKELKRQGRTKEFTLVSSIDGKEIGSPQNHARDLTSETL